MMMLAGTLPEDLRRFLGEPPSAEPSWRVFATRVLDEFDPYRMLAPQYAYGRHRGPPPRLAHPAAVMLTLYPNGNGGWSIPLTLRPPQMLDHAGQVSLPGGRSEKGESVWQTACREYGEELGCTTSFLQPVGQLKSLYVYASRHVVTPVLSVCQEPTPFLPNADEVAELLFLPLEQLLLHDAIKVGVMKRGNATFNAPGFWVGQHFVWGATAMILGEFRFALLQMQSQPSSRTRHSGNMRS
ncbi:NUDIX hydrolase [Pirellula sp. SH-Sr6A]|uniref:NUDIX hydrolase n=1 Tax=Pirellula sp. SH-Sr6A TaxID=1632865 RepID=UPI0011BA89C4|nr:CoA pyrophosphatase [Pirellula sp. SH-Sr6A]